MKEQVKLNGRIVHFKYKNDTYVVAIFDSEQEGRLTVKGNLYEIEKNENIVLCGHYEHHSKFGKQFHIERWERPMPDSKDRVITFLQSKFIKGCGKKTASRIVEELGENAIETILEEGAEVLSQIRGIGKKSALTIAESVKEKYEVQLQINELESIGIPTQMAIDAFLAFKEKAYETISKNPYKLLDIRGKRYGFSKIDEIALKIGVSPLSANRIEACTKTVLYSMCARGGHCYIPEEELLPNITKVLNQHIPSQDHVTEREIFQSVCGLEEREIIINEKGNVFPKQFYKAEKKVAMKVGAFTANKINERLKLPNSFVTLANEKIKTFQKINRTVLAEKQKEAITKILEHNFLILTGGPGTGKTFTVNAIIEIYQDIYNLEDKDIALAAPTGRAARKMAEVAEREATTVHRLIGYRKGESPEYNSNNELKKKLIVIDEISMLDIQLAELLFDAIANDTTVLLVGDVDQLPSVQSGNVLKDMIEGGVPYVRLSEVYRQAGNSQIITNAHRIKKGKNIVIDLEKKDFFTIFEPDSMKIANKIKMSVERFLASGYNIDDIMVLSPMKKGEIGTHQLNTLIQESYNPSANGKSEIRYQDTVFREGDKVMQLVNDTEKDIDNGDIGRIISIKDKLDKETGEKVLKIICRFRGKDVEYTKEELTDIQLSYCSTIHKCQGGQAPIVIMPISMEHYIMLQRNLIYTGITRAEEKVVLIGINDALMTAINNNNSFNRNTFLTNRIKNIFNQRKVSYM